MDDSDECVRRQYSMEKVSITTDTTSKQWLSVSKLQTESVSKETVPDSPVNCSTRKTTKQQLRKSVSFDYPEKERWKKTGCSVSSSLKKPIIRKRSFKRLERREPKYGHSTTEYEAIRERVLQERAVVNAIEALQERWRMLTYMYDDCVELNESRKVRRLRKLSVKRQYELIVTTSVFTLICLPVTVIMILVCRII